MASIPFPLPSLIKDEQLNIAPILHVASFLFFSDFWARCFHPIPLLEWNFTAKNIPNLFCHFVFLALLYAILFRLVKPIFLLGLSLITVHLFQDHDKSGSEVSDEWYSRYAAEINNGTAYKVAEENRLSRDRAFRTVVLISLSLLLFSMDAAFCRNIQGTVAHLILPPGIPPWAPALGFFAYLGFLLGWCVNRWGIESCGIPVTKTFRKELEQREGWTGLRGRTSVNEITEALASGGGPEKGPG